MQLTGERRLGADRATVWTMLNDAEVLKGCVPGCESLTASGENQFDIVMLAAVGPVKARFKGRMTLADIDPPNGYTLRFDGQGGPAGFARGEARVTLHEISGSETRLAYSASAQVGGKLAQVGSRLVDAAAGATADKFFQGFAAQLEARAARAPAAAAPASPQPTRVGLRGLLLAILRRLWRRPAPSGKR